MLKASSFENLPVQTSRWPLRFSDFDAVGHMNNAAYWEVLEEQLLADRGLRAPLRAIVEHVAQVEPGETLERSVFAVSGETAVLMRAEETVRAAMWCATVG